jgi:RNA 3'-terminal phosphate cyclase (ATP)
MIEIDGSEGGGQLVRTALSLSTLSGRPIDMEGVRGARSDPGFRPQHIAVLDVLAAVCDADVSSVERGTEAFIFRPGSIEPGAYGIGVGTAGSIALLFDALIPLATAIDRPLSVSARGGTDVKWSPPLSYQRRIKIPLLREHGLHAAIERERPGFYPDGGGVATLHLAPSSLSRVRLADRGEFEGARIYSLSSESLANSDVATRQAEAAADRLESADLDPVHRVVEYARTRSPGSSVVLGLDFARSVAGADALGEPGKPAESVAKEAVEDAIDVRDSSAAVDRHLADQLVLPLALAGGRVTIPAVSDHVRTSVDLLDAFGLSVRIEDGDPPELVAPGSERPRRPDS